MDPWPADEFWAQTTPGDESAYHFDSLADMTRSNLVDAVIVGHVQAIDFGRPYPDSTGDGRGTLVMAVDRVLKDPASLISTRQVLVEFYMTDVRLFPRFSGRIPPETVLLFLVNKGKQAERGGRPVDGPFAGLDRYSIVGDQGYVRDIAGRATPDANAPGSWLSDLGTKTFDAVVEEVAKATS